MAQFFTLSFFVVLVFCFIGLKLTFVKVDNALLQDVITFHDLSVTYICGTANINTQNDTNFCNV